MSRTRRCGATSPAQDAVREVTIAKLATQRTAFDVIDECLQLHGVLGYLADDEIERAARDARLGPIGGGTDEIMKEILGRSLGVRLMQSRSVRVFGDRFGLQWELLLSRSAFALRRLLGLVRRL